jgi:cytochrome c-type biogenesis protein CcmH
VAPAIDSARASALRQQMRQLQALHEAGDIGVDRFNEARAALERSIVDAVLEAPLPTQAPAPAMSRRLVLGLAALVGAVAVAGYAWLGKPAAASGDEVPTAAADQGGNAGGHSVTPAQMQGMIDKLAARLKDNPEDADGWAMLGRSYAVLGRHGEAAPALKRAVALRGDDVVLLVDCADALAVVNGRSLDGEPIRMVEHALKIDPNNIKALSLAGTHALNHQDYKLALKHWEKMAQLAPNNEMVRQVQGRMEEARKLAGGTTALPGKLVARP